DEFRAAYREEGHPRLAGDCAGQQGLARPRRSDQKDAAWDPSPEGHELLRVFEELDDFLELLFGFVNPGHVDERHRRLVGSEHPRPALAEAHRLRVRALGLPHHEQDQADEDKDRQELNEKAYPVTEAARLAHIDLNLRPVDLVLLEDLYQAGA